MTAALGTSAAVPPPRSTPPFAFGTHPPADLVTALLAGAIVCGVAGLIGVWRALRAGWAPPVFRGMVASALAVCALVLVPTIGSADPQSYAAYGRMATEGLNPYTTTPAALGGAYGAAVEAPWQHTASIYGPIATAEQAAVALVVGDNPGLAVFLLSVINGLAFLAVGLILLRLARTSAERARTLWLWSLNPLLLFELVAGAHIDTLVVAGAVAAIWAARRHTIPRLLLAGVLGGVACAIKATAALVGAALAWALSFSTSSSAIMRPSGRYCSHIASRSRGVWALAAGAAVVLVPAYALSGSHAFDQLRAASKFVSFAVPWRLVTSPLDHALGEPTSRTLLRIAGLLAAVAIAWFLARGLPGKGEPELAAARASLVLVLAWVLASTYVLPWYGGLAWALIALVPASAFDLLLFAHTTILALAYLPGRVVALNEPLRTALDVWKSGASPVLLLAVAIVAVLTARHAAAQPGHRVTLSQTEAAVSDR